MTDSPFTISVQPDWEALVSCIRREGTPARVHFIELFLDREVQAAICDRFGLVDEIPPDDPFYDQRRQIAIQSFLGYDYVNATVEGIDLPLSYLPVADTAELARSDGRNYMEEHKGPITSWAEFEAYPWPNPADATTRTLEWYEQNLPEGMCIIAFGAFGHPAEHITWLMGYESLCYALYDQRDLVEAIADRVRDIYRLVLQQVLTFDRVKVIWGSDDMGYRSGTLISPNDMRELVLPTHKLLAQMAHDAGRPYILHSCGNLRAIMEDLIDDVRIDGKHSFEDTIEDVIEDKALYGDRIALLGGIDVDFMCRAREDQVRQRVRETLEACMPGGGYCLGTGNSVANYIPLDNYLAMLDEGRRFGR